MKIIHIYTLILLCQLIYAPIEAQNQLTCKSKGSVFLATKLENNKIQVLVTDTASAKIDTLLRSSEPGSAKLKNCFCNDTSAVFFIEDYNNPTLLIFRRSKEKWEFYSFLGLNPVFPMVGVLIEGKRYESHKHNLIAIDTLVSEVSAFQADNKSRTLVPKEKYIDVFTIDYTPRPNKKFAAFIDEASLILTKRTIIHE